MNIGQLIREERKRRGLSQEGLARLIPGLGRTTISKYENGYPVPHDSLMKIIEVLRSPRLRLEALGGAIPCYYLDKVDFHPVTVQQKAIEEMKEAIAALENLNLINKTGPEGLTEEEQKQLLHETMLELQDVNICMDLILISLAERYNVDLRELEELTRRKMREKGYFFERMEVAG